MTKLTTPLPWEGKGEAPTPAAKSASAPASVTFGPKSSERLSRSELLCWLRSELQAVSRKIDRIVLHCSDTRPSQNFTVEMLAACHKKRGFGEYPGYHFYVRRDGTLHYCRPLHLKGCHVKGYNAHSIGVCYEGGHSDDATHAYEDNRTEAQKETLRQLLKVLHERWPEATICGHRDLPGVAKACPCFDAKREYACFMKNEEGRMKREE